jgi:hypothetical protein
MITDLFYDFTCRCGNSRKFSRLKKIIYPHGVDFLCKCEECDSTLTVVYERGG